MITQYYLERDDALLGQLTTSQRTKAERLLTSFALEDMVPERFHTEAVVDLMRGHIDSEGFVARVAAGRDASRQMASS